MLRKCNKSHAILSNHTKQAKSGTRAGFSEHLIMLPYWVLPLRASPPTSTLPQQLRLPEYAHMPSLVSYHLFLQPTSPFLLTCPSSSAWLLYQRHCNKVASMGFLNKGCRKSQGQDVNTVGGLKPFSLATASLGLQLLFPVIPCFQMSSSFADSTYNGLDPTPVTSFQFNLISLKTLSLNAVTF